MKTFVFVTSVAQEDHGRVIVEAINGGIMNPDIRFQIDRADSKNYHVGQRLEVTVTDAPEA